MEGASTLQVVPTYEFAKFSQKLHEIEKIYATAATMKKLKVRELGSN